MNPAGGSRPAGPSPGYLELLRGDITPEEYVRRITDGSKVAPPRDSLIRDIVLGVAVGVAIILLVYGSVALGFAL